MADNFTLDAGAGGDTFASDDIGGIHYPISKLAYGPLETAVLVEASKGLPVAPDTDGFPVEATLQTGTNEIGNVKNAGVFVAQIDGAALTALQKIDNPVAVLGTALYTEATTEGTIIGVVRNDTLATLASVDNEIAPLQVNASGALYIQQGAPLDVSGATLTINSPAVTNAGTFLVQENGAALTALQLLDNIVIVEDVDVGASATGALVMGSRTDALTAGAGVNADRDAVPFRMDNFGALWNHPLAGNLGGCKLFTSVDLDESEEDITSGATTIYSIYAWNLTAAPLWLQLFNTNTVTVGSTAPTNNYMIPANADSDGAGVVLNIPVQGLAYSAALTVAITTGSGTNSGAPGAGDAGIALSYQD